MCRATKDPLLGHIGKTRAHLGQTGETNIYGRVRRRKRLITVETIAPIWNANPDTRQYSEAQKRAHLMSPRVPKPAPQTTIGAIG